MPKFPTDPPLDRVIKAFESLGFRHVRTRKHHIYERLNPDGSITMATIPNHRVLSGNTVLKICRETNISRDEFIKAFEATK